MPYVGTIREEELKADPKVANSVGDYNALFTLAYLKTFVREPRYHTIHKIRRAAFQPNHLEAVQAVEDLLTVQGVSMFDRLVARDLAFTEFYDRVGRKYENLSRYKNGDLVAYKEADKLIQNLSVDAVAKKNEI